MVRDGVSGDVGRDKSVSLAAGVASHSVRPQLKAGPNWTKSFFASIDIASEPTITRVTIRIRLPERLPDLGIPHLTSPERTPCVEQLHRARRCPSVVVGSKQRVGFDAQKPDG